MYRRRVGLLLLRLILNNARRGNPENENQSQNILTLYIGAQWRRIV
jgi:hypothetical protein